MLSMLEVNALKIPSGQRRYRNVVFLRVLPISRADYGPSGTYPIWPRPVSDICDYTSKCLSSDEAGNRALLREGHQPLQQVRAPRVILLISLRGTILISTTRRTLRSREGR
jgi:hypothetical protein